ncbi:hypothetical protein CY34DRAFT_14517 [Suillus luteus UH-Slu-Lm8-n1]|uniref:Uncharacterized protein n=1 Tax=Suillus luteus UH-Slu-Lm8-n1 TaxID=930992 RepID=A0A0D0AXW1_9AGAM|nr:hypothetical protein CY34DRAFT_14517 [Suillus luteus UH-Slu-Lm8-n1]
MFLITGLLCRIAQFFLKTHVKNSTDTTQAVFTTINFPDLDRAVCRQRWLKLFGREDLAATVSSSEDASALILDGADIEDFMNLARGSAGGCDPTPQHVKASLKEWEVPLSIRSKVARFFALREIHPPILALDEPIFQEHGTVKMSCLFEIVYSVNMLFYGS